MFDYVLVLVALIGLLAPLVWLVLKLDEASDPVVFAVIDWYLARV